MEDRGSLETLSGTGNPNGRPSFLSNCTIALASQIGGTLLTIVLEVSYARLLGPAGRGILSLLMNTISFAGLIGGLGGEIPIILWTADRTRTRREFLPAILFWGLVGSLATSALWAVVFWIIHPAFLKGVTPRLAMLVLAAIPAYIFFGYFAAGLLGAERFGHYAKFLIGQKVLILAGISILIFYHWMSAETALLTNLLATLLVLSSGLVLARKYIPKDWNLAASRPKFKQTLSLGTRGQVGNAASFLNYRLDVFFVNKFLGPAQVGLYSVGVMVSESLWQLPYAMALALLPRTARTLREDNAPFTCLVVRRVLALASAGGIILAVSCVWIVPRIFGSKFQESLPVIWWILPGTVAFASGKVMAADLAARKKVGYNSVSAMLALALTIALDMVLIPRMGINGAALTSSAAYLFNTALLAVKLKGTLSVTWRSLFVSSPSDFSFLWQAWRGAKESR
jgi:O-antigen/teichoic acid export membrane protein